MQNHPFLRSISRALAGAVFGVVVGIVVIALTSVARPPARDIDGAVERVVVVGHGGQSSTTERNSEAILREIAFAQVGINDMEGATETVEGMGRHRVNQDLVWNQIVAMLVMPRFDLDDAHVAAARQIATKINDDLYRADAIRRIAVTRNDAMRRGPILVPPPRLEGEAPDAPGEPKDAQRISAPADDPKAVNDAKAALREASRLALAARWVSPDHEGILSLLWKRLDLLGVLAFGGAVLFWLLKPLLEQIRDLMNRKVARRFGLGAADGVVAQRADTK